MIPIVTVWCDQCAGPSTVIQDSIETDPSGVDWRVRLLDCGHEETEKP